MKTLSILLRTLAGGGLVLALGCVLDATVDIDADLDSVTDAVAESDDGGCPEGSHGCACGPMQECEAGLYCDMPSGSVCVLPGDTCHDGFWQPWEACDPSVPESPPDCSPECTLECGDMDGDGFTPCDGDCDDFDPMVSPGHPEFCDGQDNDCDGMVDEGCDGMCGNGLVDQPSEQCDAPDFAGQDCATLGLGGGMLSCDAMCQFDTSGCFSMATCTDATQNGMETDIDCGGPDCPACSVGNNCSVASDCVGLVCAFGVCQPPTCDDGVHNGDETDVDCGGSCTPCATGNACNVATDCIDSVCVGGVCQPPSCADGVQNGDETGADCGGSTCPPC